MSDRRPRRLVAVTAAVLCAVTLGVSDAVLAGADVAPSEILRDTDAGGAGAR